MPRRLGSTIAVLALMLTACGSDADLGSPTSTTVAVSPTTVAVSPTTVTSQVASPATSSATTTPTKSLGCTEGSTDVPAGAAKKEVADVDGDGLGDTAWIVTADDGHTKVGIVTAAGGGAERVFESASPVERSILVTDADRKPPVEIFADDGRSVQLWAFSDCAIVDVDNPQGETYVFSLGFSDVGTGVGCVDIAGRQQLVGLDIVSDTSDTVDWSRTIVELDGTNASNGATSTGTFTRPADDARIELLHEVTCGDLTILDDGLRAPTP